MASPQSNYDDPILGLNFLGENSDPIKDRIRVDGYLTGFKVIAEDIRSNPQKNQATIASAAEDILEVLRFRGLTTVQDSADISEKLAEITRVFTNTNSTSNGIPFNRIAGLALLSEKVENVNSPLAVSLAIISATSDGLSNLFPLAINLRQHTHTRKNWETKYGRIDDALRNFPKSITDNQLRFESVAEMSTAKILAWIREYDPDLINITTVADPVRTYTALVTGNYGRVQDALVKACLKEGLSKVSTALKMVVRTFSDLSGNSYNTDLASVTETTSSLIQSLSGIEIGEVDLSNRYLPSYGLN